MKRCLLLFTALLFIISSAQSQGTVFGVKGGPSLAFQKWNNFDRDPLFAYHIMTYVESLPEYPDDLTLFAQVGYHQRGSALRFRRQSVRDGNGSFVTVRAFSQRFKFNNIALSLGAKQRFNSNDTYSLYYMLGIRGEYTLNTNLFSLDDENIPNQLIAFYPVDDLVRKFNGGIIVGAGIEFNFAEYIGGLIELTFNQDFTKQYEQLPVRLSTGSILQETIIRNSTIELTLGIRLLRKVEYID